MSEGLTVNKLVSLFGFEVDQASKSKALKEVREFKKKLADVEVKVKSAASSRTSKKAAKTELDAHVKLLDNKLRAEGRSQRRRRKLLSDANQGIVSDLKASSKRLKSVSSRQGTQSFINSSLIGKAGSKASDTAFADQMRGDAAGEKSAARERLRSMRERISILGNEARLLAGINDTKRIQVQYEQELAKIQKMEVEGVGTQLEREKLINQALARRDGLLDKLNRKSSGGVGGAGRASLPVAEAAGIAGGLGGASKFAKGLVPAAAAGGAAFGSVMAVQGLFGQAQKIEKFRLALTAVEGSAEKAEAELEHFRETALKTNVSLDSGLESYRKFFVSMRAAGQGADLTRETFDSMSRAASVLGISQDDTNGILRAFGQIAGKGKVMAEEMTQQLGDRMPGALGMVARGLDITTEELYAMMAAGELSAETFFPAMISVMDEFSDKAGDISGTLPGLWDSLRDAIIDISFQLDKLGFNEDLKSIIGNLKDLATGFVAVLVPAIAVFVKALTLVMNVIGTKATGFILGLWLATFAVRSLAAAFTLARLEAVLLGFINLVNWIGKLRAVLMGSAIWANLLAAPFWLIVGAIAAVVLIVQDLWTAMNGGDAVFNGLFDGLLKVFEPWMTMIDAIGDAWDDLMDLVGLGDSEPVSLEVSQKRAERAAAFEEFKETARGVGGLAGKYGVADGKGGTHFSQLVADQGQVGLDFLSKMGTDPQTMAYATEQLKKQGGQPVNIVTHVTIEGNADETVVRDAVNATMNDQVGHFIQSMGGQ